MKFYFPQKVYWHDSFVCQFPSHGIPSGAGEQSEPEVAVDKLNGSRRAVGTRRVFRNPAGWAGWFTFGSGRCAG